MIGVLIGFKLEIDNICRQKTDVARAIKNTESESPKKKWAARNELVNKTTELDAELWVLRDKIYSLFEQTPYNTFVRQLNAGSAKTQHLRANNQQPMVFDAIPSVSQNGAPGRREQTEPPAELSAALPSVVTKKQQGKKNRSVSAPRESMHLYTIEQKNEALALVRIGGNGPAALSNKLRVSRPTAQVLYSVCRNDIALETKKNAVDARLYGKKAVGLHLAIAARAASKRPTAPTHSDGQDQPNADDAGVSSSYSKKRKLDQGKDDRRNRSGSTMLEKAVEFAEAENAQKQQSAKPLPPPTVKTPKQLQCTGAQQQRPASADSGSAAYAANLLLSLAAESTAGQNYGDELDSGNAADEESAARLELVSGKKKFSAATFRIEPLKGILKPTDRPGRY